MSEEDLQKRLEGIAQRFFIELREVVPFDKASVQWVVDNRRRLVDGYNIDKENLQSSLTRSLEKDALANRIVKDQEPVIIPDTNRSSEFVKEPGAGTDDVNSWIGWPLIFQERTVGILTLDHSVAGQYQNFTNEDRRAVDKLTTALARALHEEYAREEEAQKIQALKIIDLGIHDKGLELILKIGKKILQAADIHAVLNAIVSGAMELTNTDSGVIYLLNSRGDEVLDKFHTGDHPDPRLRNETGITKTVIHTKSPVWIPDITQDPRVNDVLKQKYRSMFAIPLMLEDFVMGVLYLNGEQVRELTDTEKSLLETLADQAAIAVQNKNSQAMYQAIPQNVILKDRHSRIRAANASFCAGVSTPSEEWKEKDIVGMRDHEIYPKEIADSYVKKDQEVIHSKEKRETEELNVSRRTGKADWVQAVKSPVLGADGEVMWVQAIFWNINEQKENRERWKSLVLQSPDGIVVHQNGEITLANDAACRLLGVETMEDLKRKSIMEFVDPESLSLAEERLQKLVRKEPVEMVAMKIRGKSGRVVEAEVYAHSGPGEGEVQVVLHDLSRRKKLMREVEEQAERSEQIMRISAHELRTPLQNIISLLTALKHQPEDLPKISEQIDREVFRAKQRMNNALSFDKPIGYHFKLEGTLGDLITTAEQEIALLSRERRMRIELHESAKRLPAILMDADRMGQVIQNLLDNAIQYSPKGGTVHIGGQESESQVEFFIENVTEAMPVKLEEVIFEPKKRLTVEEQQELIAGSGLGCPLVKTFVTGHRGEVRLEVEPMGAGREGGGRSVRVRFRVTLPKPKAGEEFPKT